MTTLQLVMQQNNVDCHWNFHSRESYHKEANNVLDLDNFEDHTAFPWHFIPVSNCYIFVLDLLKVFKPSDEKLSWLPCFVVFQLDEVPMIPGEITASLSRKVNELYGKFDNFDASNHNSASISEWEVPFPSCLTTRPSYTLILKNSPKKLLYTSARKVFLDIICHSYASSIPELKPHKKDWKLLVNDKHLANSFVHILITF